MTSIDVFFTTAELQPGWWAYCKLMGKVKETGDWEKHTFLNEHLHEFMGQYLTARWQIDTPFKVDAFEYVPDIETIEAGNDIGGMTYRFIFNDDNLDAAMAFKLTFGGKS